MQKIVKCNVSISRFGDGELMIALLERGISFQKKNRELSARLKQILYEKDSRLLVCMNNEFMRNNEIFWVLQYERSSKKYIRFETWRDPNDIGILSRKAEWAFYNECYRILFGKKKPSVFGDATLFMLGLYTEEYKKAQMERVFELFVTLFKKKRLLIAAPKTPLMAPSFRELEPKLLAAGASGITHIDMPEKDAYTYYQEIKSKILNSTNFDAVWIQAGPAASILAHDLATNHDILSYDIGSLNTTLRYIL
ncbi:GT-D fold domain-containing glycosyltransferase [Chlorobaculum limnaeum]|nr:GT-D fold domain-containing glycosyltransferase [Chlorobaculum limnaeum]